MVVNIGTRIFTDWVLGWVMRNIYCNIYVRVYRFWEKINRATWDGGSVNFWAEGLFGDKFPVEQSIKVGRCSYGFFCLI